MSPASLLLRPSDLELCDQLGDGERWVMIAISGFVRPHMREMMLIADERFAKIKGLHA
jgi:hypothetical protein